MPPGSFFERRARVSSRVVAHPVSDEVVIRRCLPEDAPQVTMLCEEMGHRVNEEDAFARLSLQARDPNYGTWLAADQGRALGLLSGHIVHHIEQAPVAHLLALVVERRSQGRGVSGRLVSQFDVWAREAGAGRAIVVSGDHKRGGHRGFEEYDFEADGARFVKTYYRASR